MSTALNALDQQEAFGRPRLTRHASACRSTHGWARCTGGLGTVRALRLGQVLAGLDNLQSRIDDVQAACAPADLFPVPLPGSNPLDFCRTDEQGHLVVRVKNQGSVAAPASSVRVTFSTPSGPMLADLPTPVLAGAGGLVDVTSPVPADCLLRGACNFHIAVDADEAVFESDETNNSASGVCTVVE